MAETIKLLSFDPGLTALGWATSVYDRSTGVLHVHKFGDIKASKIAAKDKERVEEYGQRLITLDVVERETVELMESWKPDVIGSEAAFFHPRRPAAYVALLLCIHTIENLLFTRYHKKLFTFPPRVVKLNVSGTGLSDKSEIQRALIEHPNITFKHNKTNPLENMSQHAADAIGVAYTTAIHLDLHKPV